MTIPYQITSVEPLGGFLLRLTFDDGVIAELDLEPRLQLARGPMFEPLRDVDFFAQVRVDAELGTIVWPNGADLAPEVLHAEAMAAA